MVREERGAFPALPHGRSLIVLGEAARLLRQTRPKGESGGRPGLLEAYALEVESLWHAVKSTGIKPGRGGDFERLCELFLKLLACRPKQRGLFDISQRTYSTKRETH